MFLVFLEWRLLVVGAVNPSRQKSAPSSLDRWIWERVRLPVPFLQAAALHVCFCLAKALFQRHVLYSLQYLRRRRLHDSSSAGLARRCMSWPKARTRSALIPHSPASSQLLHPLRALVQDGRMRAQSRVGRQTGASKVLVR
ncbi:uncharacterized protein BKA78DRAFT_325539 [Phyllosticta capitalensis]|uniref:uncharacterized protein n=1 Tax=Phyllosticta capitalensis TaxID=121624 RepID=UPI00312E2237